MDDSSLQSPSDPSPTKVKENDYSLGKSPDVIVVNDDDEGDVDFGDDSNDSVHIEVISDDDEMKWKSTELLQTLISRGYRNPHLLLTRLFHVNPESIPRNEPELWAILATLFAERSIRRPLKQYHSLQSAINLLRERSKILVLTGAGISVSCGIPDFRSRNGVYARLARDFPDLCSPQDMFDLKFFYSNPNPFFKFAKELFPGQFKPSYTHRFIRLIEKKSKLLRNYTQNIDTLEELAGISRVIPCHGPFATATCLGCKFQVPGEEIREAIMSQRIPYCPKCCPEVGLKGIPAVIAGDPETQSENESATTPVTSVMKPDIVFFGESLPPQFHSTLEKDVKDVDLVLVMGSSLKVKPVSYIPNNVPHRVPQILINREPLSNHSFDVELLGDCDVIIEHLCKELGWTIDSDRDVLDSASEENSVETSLKQVDLVVPLKAALEAFANELDSSLSSPYLIRNPGNPLEGTDTLDSKTKETSEASYQDSIPSVKITHSDQEEDVTNASGTVTEADGTAECPINVDDSESVSDSDDSSSFSGMGRRIFKLAKFLPENTYTYIPRRLYIFQGSELAISVEMAEEYVATYSQNADSNGYPHSPEGSQSSNSSVDTEESYIDHVIRRCLQDPELEEERRRCIEAENEDKSSKEGGQEGIEVINCGESSSESDHEPKTSEPLECLHSDSQETKKTPPPGPIKALPPKIKRRRRNDNSEGKSDNEVVSVSSNQLQASECGGNVF